MSGRVLGVAVGGPSDVHVGSATVEVIRLGEIPRGEFSRSDYQDGPDAVPECEMRGTRMAGATADTDGEFLIDALPGGLFALRATAPEGSSFSVPGAICYFPIAGDSAFLGIEIRVREPGATLPGSGSGPGTGADSTG
jgi:hypothetical protein